MIADTELMAKIAELRKTGKSWESIGADIGISGALVWKVGKGLCTSHKARSYFKLLPRKTEITTCSECGQVHLKKTCVAKANNKPVDRMAARLSVDDGRKARAMLAEGGYSSITDFWREFIKLAD